MPTMAGATKINFTTPGKARMITCEDFGTHYILPGDKRVDMAFLNAAMAQFAGQTVPGDFYMEPGDRAAASFTEWVDTASPSLSGEPLRAVDACFVAAILRGGFGVAAVKRGPRDKIYLKFP